MGISIYIRLLIALVFGKIKIQDKYKHLDYMLENNFLTPIQDEWINISGFPLPAHSDWYTITNTGKKAMWGKEELIHTKVISWLAFIVSVISLWMTINSN